MIYGDLRPENILMDYQNGQVGEIKLINCGQSSSLQDFEPLFQKHACWNYQPPEHLNYMLKMNFPVQHKRIRKEYFRSTNLNSDYYLNYDIWSFGILLIEIITGVPTWIHEKSVIKQFNNRCFLKNQGHFNFQKFYKKDDRDLLTGIERIINVHLENLKTPKKLKSFLKKCGGCYNLWQDESLVDLLANMLQIDPSQRINADQILAHPYCQNINIQKQIKQPEVLQLSQIIE